MGIGQSEETNQGKKKKKTTERDSLWTTLRTLYRRLHWVDLWKQEEAHVTYVRKSMVDLVVGKGGKALNESIMTADCE